MQQLPSINNLHDDNEMNQVGERYPFLLTPCSSATTCSINVTHENRGWHLKISTSHHLDSLVTRLFSHNRDHIYYIFSPDDWSTLHTGL